MAKEAELLDMAAALYEAALEPDAWADALAHVGGLMNADWSLLGVYRRDGCPEFLAQDAAGDAEHFALFNDHYAQPETNPSIPLLLAADLGAIVIREQVHTDEAWRRTPLYRDIYRPRDLYHGLGAVVLDDAPHVAFLGVNRVKRSIPYTAPDLDLLRAALPHVRRALQVFLRLTAGNSQRRAHEQAWDMLACGVILLDAAGKILWMNRSAAAVLARADGHRIAAQWLIDLRHPDGLAPHRLPLPLLFRVHPRPRPAAPARLRVPLTWADAPRGTPPGSWGARAARRRSPPARCAPSPGRILGAPPGGLRWRSAPPAGS